MSCLLCVAQLEDRGSFIIRTMCAESSGLDSKTIYITMAKQLLAHNDVEFAKIMVQVWSLSLSHLWCDCRRLLTS